MNQNKNGERFCAQTIRIFSITNLLILAILTVVSCAKQPKQITLLYTNDMHAHFLPAPALRDKPPLGGFVALDCYVKQQRGLVPNSLLFDAGDLMTGNLICDMDYKGAEGGILIEMMNMIGYDGRVFGNHDCDKQIGNLRKMNELAKFPTLCANFKDTLGRDFTNEQYHIYNINGVRVGVIGLTYYPMAGMANPSSLLGFNSLDPIETANKIIPQIDSLTDIIVLLTHIGIENDRELARNTKGADIIIGGHSHTRLDTAEVVNGVLIVQGGSYARYLGRLDLTVVNDSVVAHKDTLIALTVKDLHPNPKLQAIADSFATEIDAKFAVPIGTLKNEWTAGHGPESNVGSWLAEAIRAKTGADVGIVNSGGIRRDIPAGPITLKDIYEMLPFDNYVTSFTCTGADLLKIFGGDVENEAGSGNHGALQISGAKYAFKMEDGKTIIVESSVGGQKLDPVKTYKVTTIDYVISNKNKYLHFDPQNITGTETLMSDMIIEAIKKAGVIDSKIEGNIRKIE
jgi:2',3'-cyclic-nucleotide 2'-phosphodiesterase (5'-nucleotidase family)